MATFKSYFGAVVVTIIFTAAHGLSIRSSSSSSFMGDVMKGTLLRETRDIPRDAANVTFEADIDPCGEIVQCVMDDGGFLVSHNVMQFNFEDVLSDIPSICEDNPEFDCNGDGCEGMQGFPEFVHGIGELACDQREGLQNGSMSSCWEGEFKATMRNCLNDNPTDSPFDPAIEDLLECFAAVPKDLPNCTDDDIEFIASFTRGIVSVGREAYAAQRE